MRATTNVRKINAFHYCLVAEDVKKLPFMQFFPLSTPMLGNIESQRYFFIYNTYYQMWEIRLDSC